MPVSTSTGNSETRGVGSIEAARREPNKLATTNVTNAIVDYIGGAAPNQRSSNVAPGYAQAWDILGLTTNKGPNGEDDFKNNMYWFEPQLIKPNSQLALMELATNSSGFPIRPLPAENLAERPPKLTPEEMSAASGSSGTLPSTSGPHLLRYGTPVLVSAAYDASADRPRLRYFFSRPPDPIYIRITASTLIAGQQNRWQYSWVEMEYLQDGRWQDVAGGLTSATAGGSSGSGGAAYAYNRLENGNADTGLAGTGADLTYLSSSLTFYPIRGNGVHEARAVISCVGKLEYHFEAVNYIAGACP